MEQWSPVFLAPGTGFIEDQSWGWGEWFWNDSSAVGFKLQ